jgi:hypothetical protein
VLKPSGIPPTDSSTPDALEPALQKVHLRGLDNLTTKDIKSFASEYFPSHSPSHIEWIDDTSANLVYETPETAREALVAFSAVEIADISQIPPLQTIPAKSFPSQPQTSLELRLAVVGDRKQVGARDRSRFYLFNPEHDPAERRKQAGHKGRNKYRDRDDGGYRSQRYDEREHRKRQNDDEELGFDASIYDDDEAALARRATKQKCQDSTSSGSDSRGQKARRVQFRGTAGKELFPNRGDDGGSGRLRDRSASPVRGSDEDRDMEKSRNSMARRQDDAAVANRLKAQMIKSRLREAGTTKELFPHKAAVNHRRSDAFDAADETADLFSNKMPVPFLDGSGDRKSKSSGFSLASRITGKTLSPEASSGFSIRGASKVKSSPGFSIKGAASSDPEVKELFPSRAGDNAGKELFSERVGRGRRRQKAEDLFY